MAVVSLLISLAAIVISLAAFWKTHLSPFSAITVAGRLRLRIYPIRGANEERWFVASFDLPIGVTNEGARPGVVDGLRLRLHFPNVPIPGNHEFVPPIFEIDPENANEISENRFKWIDEIVRGDWMPFTILPKTTVTKHFIFETRWEAPVIQEVVDCSLEIRADAGDWRTVKTWDLGLNEGVWSMLADGATAINYHNPPSMTRICTPPDLHKYIGSKAEISKARRSGPSHLDYPK